MNVKNKDYEGFWSITGEIIEEDCLMKCMKEVMMTSKAKDEEADDDIFLELKILQFLATRFLPSGKKGLVCVARILGQKRKRSEPKLRIELRTSSLQDWCSTSKLFGLELTACGSMKTCG